MAGPVTLVRSPPEEGRSLEGRAAEEAYRRYFPIVRAKCVRMLGDRDEAEDVAQETFVRLWQEGLLGLSPGRVVSWVYRTSTRLSIDRIRRRRVREAGVPGPAVAAPPDEAHAARERIERIAGGVPAEELEIVILTRIDGLGQQEAAEVAQVSERTVRRLLRRFDERVAALREEPA